MPGGHKNLPAIAFFLLVLSACKKEGPDHPQPPATSGPKVFVVCEGASSQGNGQLDLDLPDQDSLYTDVYRSANGQPLGDVFQSMARIGDRYFLCVNNSDKVVCIRK